MNLQKMLNVFILIFIILNIGLFSYNTYNDSVKYTLSNARVDLLRETLANKGVLLYSIYPTKYYPMSKLVIREPEHNESELISKLFGEESVSGLSDEEHRYGNGTNGQEETLILKVKKKERKGLVIYNNMAPDIITSNIRNPLEVQQLVDPFVETITLGNGKFELVDERSNEVNAMFEYNERFEDQLLFCNEVIVRVSELDGGFGITEATSIRYTPLYFSEEQYQIYPADEVLYKFLMYVEEEGLSDIRITNVEIGYLLGPDGLRNLKSDEIDPYYRIRTGDGQEFYVNAFTNELLVF